MEVTETSQTEILKSFSKHYSSPESKRTEKYKFINSPPLLRKPSSDHLPAAILLLTLYVNPNKPVNKTELRYAETRWFPHLNILYENR